MLAMSQQLTAPHSSLQPEVAPTPFYAASNGDMAVPLPNSLATGARAVPEGQASGSETSGFEEEQEAEGDSDFELDPRSSGQGSPMSNADVSDSDGGGGGRKRHRPAGTTWAHKRPRTGLDNPMRLKLRANEEYQAVGALTPPPPPPPHPVQGTSSQDPADGEANDVMASEAAEQSEQDAEFENYDDLTIPQREVAPGQEDSERAALCTSWQFTAILDFFEVFRELLRFGELRFDANELETELIRSNGEAGLLPALHLVLLHGISPRTKVEESRWAASVAEKLKYYWRMSRMPGVSPFVPQKRYEAVAYATLPTMARMETLKCLCDIRLDREDIQNLLEFAVNPPRVRGSKKPKLDSRGRPIPEPPTPPQLSSFRREALGVDSSGLTYWFLDYESTTGFRLYRETPEELLKGKPASKGKGKRAQPPREPGWEFVTSDADEITALGEKLKRSKKAEDQHLAALMLEGIVVVLEERRLAAERRDKAAARMRSQLRTILPASDDGYGRSRRERKAVNYTYEDYDATIRSAMRRGRHAEDDNPSRRLREPMQWYFLWKRPTAEEDARNGLRRGRSAYAAEPPLELPDTRRKRRAASAAAEEENASLAADDHNGRIAPGTENGSPNDMGQEKLYAVEAPNGASSAWNEGVVTLRDGLHNESVDVSREETPAASEDVSDGELPKWGCQRHPSRLAEASRRKSQGNQAAQPAQGAHNWALQNGNRATRLREGSSSAEPEISDDQDDFY